jgi:hypothetical protein
MRNSYTILIGTCKGKISVGRLRRRWECNIKISHKEIGYESVVWIRLAQDRDQWRTVVKTNKFPGSLKGGEFLDKLSDYYFLKKENEYDYGHYFVPGCGQGKLLLETRCMIKRDCF